MFLGVKAKFLEIIMQALEGDMANLRELDLDFHHLATYKDENILGKADIQLVSSTTNILAIEILKYRVSVPDGEWLKIWSPCAT